MKNLDWYRKNKEAHDSEIAKLSDNLEKLKLDRAGIDEKIDAAIDSGKYDTVEDLTALATDLDNRIRTAEKILNRRKDAGGFSKDEIIAASDSETKKYQADVDAAMKEAEKYRRMYFTKLIEAGKIARAADAVRSEYISLSNEIIGGNEIESVHGNFSHGLHFTGEERQYVNGIDAEGYSLINRLRR